MRAEFERNTNVGSWYKETLNIIKKGEVDANFQLSFHSYWTEAAHRIREQINDDDLLASMLQIALPKYDGPQRVLFRGENADRWNEGRIGFCWSPKSEIARMFGRGLNATKSGGMLLKCDVPTEAIFAGPSEHSYYLGEEEFTVNPKRLTEIEVICQYTSPDGS